MGFPRHLSQHVGGFVITRDQLDHLVPISQCGDGRPHHHRVGQGRHRRLGILKVDVLALGMLTCIRRAFELMHVHYGMTSDAGHPAMSAEDDDPGRAARVYKMTHRADTIGVFQIESRAQMSMLPRLKPKEFYDLVIEVAIVRPGPIQGGMVHPYLKRRLGLEKVDYPSKELEAVLERTIGRAAVSGAGDADRHRRRRLLARRGRQASPLDGDLQAHRQASASSAKSSSRA